MSFSGREFCLVDFLATGGAEVIVSAVAFRFLVRGGVVLVQEGQIPYVTRLARVVCLVRQRNVHRHV
jgi:hypothetical protein